MITDTLPALHVLRLPSEFGPMLRCRGELSVATAEQLRRELVLLEPLKHPVIILNLAECDYLDVDGLLTILQSFKRRREEGRRLVIVAGKGAVRRLLDIAGIDWIVPVFPTEEVALLTLRGGGPPLPPPETWEAARALTLGRWRFILEAIESAPAQEIVELLTSMTSLCDRAEATHQQRRRPAVARCESCPLFHALGGESQDIGCHRVLAPIIEALRVENREAARGLVETMISTIREMPLPEETKEPPVPPFMITHEALCD
jgi:anti-anti-sigma factor